MAMVPLRVRLVGVVVLLSALALTLSGAAANTALRGFLVQQVDDKLASTSGHLPISNYVTGGSSDTPGRRGPDPLSDAYVKATDGSTTVESQLHTGVSAPALPSDLTNHATDDFTVSSADGASTWRVHVTVDDDYVMAVALPLDSVDAVMHQLLLLEIFGGGAVLVILGGVGYVMVRRSLRPLVKVELAAERVAAGDLTQRVPEDDPRTEVGSLSRSFNAMVAQIEAAFEAQAESEVAARQSEEQARSSEEQARSSEEQARESASQAQASERRMRRFVADASHELRTPLTSIRGFAELYRHGALPGPADVDRAMSRVESEARRMGELVDDLLMLARLDQQRPLERGPVDLATLAGRVVQSARAAAPDRAFTLETDSAVTVDGDSGRLAQVLTNLLANAVAHTPGAAAVTVRVGAETEADLETGTVAVIEVADDGPGITDADKEHVFERFYRADASRTRASGGSGLGLSIVAGIVQAHGGEVTVHDTPGGGATFRVELPLALNGQPGPRALTSA